MSIEIESVGQLARVTAISNGGHTAFFELRNGNTGSLTNSPEYYAIGDVLIISGDIENNIDVSVAKAPPATWPNYLWVGIVKLKLSDITIIESGGRFRLVPTNSELDYALGNTVQVSDHLGVTRVLSEKPIKYVELDLPQLDDDTIARFRSAPTEHTGLTFEDFGGSPQVVARARELIEIPLRNSDRLCRIGVRPIKGVLFTGEPGTGKTLLARIIAAQSNVAFYEISGPEIFSKWYGQSEELLRLLFESAAEENNAIIFFDEIDSVAAQRADHSHEASKRVVAQLLTLMDGFTSDTNVIVIAATNRAQDLDVALRRPGRFDWEIDFPYPDQRDRADILRKTGRKLRTKTPLPHDLVAAASEGWSGAELTQIWREAALLAVEDRRSDIFEEDYIGGFERVSLYRNRPTVVSPEKEQ